MSKENLSPCYILYSWIAIKTLLAAISMLVASHYLMAFTYYSVVSDFFVSSLYLHPKGEQIAYLHLLDSKGDEDPVSWS